MASYMVHPDQEVKQALIRLCDALCTWERNTGRTSALILREKGGFVFRASSGKPMEENPLISPTDLELIHVETN
jgi:hypothetical protein